MSINSVNTTPSAAVPLPVVSAATSTGSAAAVSSTPSSSTPTPSTDSSSIADQVTISSYGQRAAQFIQEARALPSQSTAGLNADQLKQLKQQLDAGKYPPQGLTEGLLSLLGSSLIGSDQSD